MIKLFELQNNKIIPSEHCYTIKWLNDIMIKYKKDKEYLKVYSYLFYMSCNNPDFNPYFNMDETIKEETILNDLDAEFSVEEPDIIDALEKTKLMYETPTYRAYIGIKKSLDRIANYMSDTEITDGKDGNINQIRAMAKDFEGIRQSFKGAYKDLENEQSSKIRGNKKMGYDQM
jgi:hypothetical protein